MQMDMQMDVNSARPWVWNVASCLVLAASVAASVAACGGARGVLVEIDDVRARTPSTWAEVEPVQPPVMRQFVLPGGLEDDAELSIFHYGRGYGGDIQTNVERWKSSFEPPHDPSPGSAAGRPAAEKPEATAPTIDDFTTVSIYRTESVRMTIVDIRGTYLHRDRPLDVRSEPQRRRKHRLIGVVFESRHGPYFLRLVGPEPTVNRHEQAFLRWLRAFR